MASGSSFAFITFENERDAVEAKNDAHEMEIGSRM